MIRSKIDMVQATLLTRQGRLAEAMALLQGKAFGASRLATAHSPASDTGDKTVGQQPFLDAVSPSRGSGQSWTIPTGGLEESGTALKAPRGLLDRLRAFNSKDVVDGLLGRAIKPALPQLPDGAKFYDHSFSNGAGTRTYKLYVPSGYTGQPLPLVVMLHGCTQSPDDFAAGTRMNELAEEQKFFVAYPAQTQSANASKCWNWFSASDQRRDQGEPSLIAGITRQIMKSFSVEARRVYIAGLSAGGAAAAVMGAAYPDLYAAIGVHSGLACGAASDMPSAFAAMRTGSPSTISTQGVPTIVFHGDADTTVHPINGDQVAIQGKAGLSLSSTSKSGVAPGGVRYTRKIHFDESGTILLEQWILHDVGHAWSGGSSIGSYTEPRGPDASREMVRFFLEHSIRL